MSFKELTWKVNTSQYGTEELTYLGKWRVGSYHWDAFRSKDSDKPPYRASCALPGTNPDLGNYKTIEEAKAKVQQAVDYWITKAQGE